MTHGSAGVQTVIERTRAGGGDTGRQGEGGAGQGLASERLRGPPCRARSAPGVPANKAREGPAGGRATGRARARLGPRRPARWRAGHGGRARSADGTYLVDPANSHMLVSKAKPCTCKHRLPHGEAVNGSLDRLQFIRSYTVTWITVVILELIHATSAPTCLAGRGEFIRSKPTGLRGPSPLVTQDNFGLIARPWRRRRIFQVSALSSSVYRCPGDR